MKIARYVMTAACALGALCLQAQQPAPTEPPNSGKSIWTQNVTKFRKEHSSVGGYKKRWDLAALPHYVPTRHLNGTLRIWGSNYLKDGELGEYWKSAFEKFQPGIKIEYHLPTEAVAIPALATGVADLGMSNKATLSDLLTFEQVYHHSVSDVMVATGSYDVYGWSPAFIIVVNRDNPLTHISLKQLDDVFGSARAGGYEGSVWHTEHPYSRGPEENIRTWGQLGLTGDWADKPIHTGGQNLRAGATIGFSDQILRGSDQFVEGYRTFTNYVTPDGKMNSWSMQSRRAMAQDRYAIYAVSPLALGPEMKELAIGPDGGPYVKRTLETVHDRSYPLARAMRFYFNRNPGQPVDPKVDEFLKFVLSREGQDCIQREGRYLPLMGPVVTAQLKKLDAAVAAASR